MKLTIQRAGKLIGTWELGSEPLSLSISDDHKDLVQLTIQSPKQSKPDLPTPVVPEDDAALSRHQGDDFTMPMPVNTDKHVVPTNNISLPEAVRQSFSRSEVPIFDWSSSASSPIGEQTGWSKSESEFENFTLFEPLEIWEYTKGRWSFAQLLSSGEKIDLLDLVILFEPDSGRLVFSGKAPTQVVLIDEQGQRRKIDRVNGQCALSYGKTALIRTSEQAYCIRASQEDDSASI